MGEQSVEKDAPGCSVTDEQAQAVIRERLRLGIYQGNALAAPPLALVAFMADLPLPALILAACAVIGWAGWARDFGLRWRP